MVLHKWIEAGLLIASKQGRVWQIANADMERFRATYYLADEVQRSLCIVATTLTRGIDVGRILPAYSRRIHPGAGASVFRRADVETLQREITI